MKKFLEVSVAEVKLKEVNEAIKALIAKKEKLEKFLKENSDE